jgi:hypothetical protein
MKPYEHRFGDSLPASVYHENEQTGSLTQIINLEKTTLIFGRWAVPGESLANLLGLANEPAVPSSSHDCLPVL